MQKNEKMDLIRESGVVAIMRAERSQRLMEAAAALQAGGVRAVEVTMNTPGALDTISAAAGEFGQELLFGAGTVLDAETARLAILAGADFIVSPALNLDVIALCRRYSTPVFPGCYTPTEALAAWEAGADMIKLFPAGFGGPGLLKALLAPLPQLEILPVGGVDLSTAADFIRAGAAALGVGGGLVNQALLDAGDMAEIRRRAAAFVQAVENGRS